MAERNEEYVPEGEIAIEEKNRRLVVRNPKYTITPPLLQMQLLESRSLAAITALRLMLTLVATLAVFFNILEVVTVTLLKLSVISRRILRSFCPKLKQNAQSPKHLLSNLSKTCGKCHQITGCL